MNIILLPCKLIVKILVDGYYEQVFSKRLFQEIETQINNVIILNTPILWMGGLNKKFGQNYIQGDNHQTTPNGELITDIILKYYLVLVNSSPVYSGLWRRFKKILELQCFIMW